MKNQYTSFVSLTFFFALFIANTCIILAEEKKTNNQEEKKLNVAYVNERFRTTLLFPKPLQQVFLGNNEEFLNFDITRTEESFGNRIISLQYNREGVEEKTNLTIITEEGNVYEFLLTYIAGIPDPLTTIIKPEQASGNILESEEKKKKIEEENMLIKEEENLSFIDKALANTNEKRLDMIREAKLKQRLLAESKKQIKNQNIWTNPDVNLEISEIAKIRGVALHILQEKQDFGGRYAHYKKQGMEFELLYTAAFDNKLYLKFIASNTTGIPYKIGFIKYSISISKTNSKTTNQERYIIPVLTVESPEVIEAESSNTFITVLETQAMDENKGLEIQFWEENGERNLGLFIPVDVINHPAFLSKSDLKKYAY